MNMTRYRPIAALLLAAAVAACGDYDKKGFQDITGPVTGARVKFFNFGVNAPSVNFYANDTKVTAIATGSCFGVTDTATVRVCNSTGLESTTGVAYGSAGLGGLYSAVASGQYTLNGRIAAATDRPVPAWLPSIADATPHHVTATIVPPRDPDRAARPVVIRPVVMRPIIARPVVARPVVIRPVIGAMIVAMTDVIIGELRRCRRDRPARIECRRALGDGRIGRTSRENPAAKPEGESDGEHDLAEH